MVYLFLGPSGCGKDTQVDMVLEKLNAQKIATGEMFRTEFANKTPNGIEAEKSWGAGKWVSDELTYSMLKEWLKKSDPERTWIFVSTVRTPEQIPLFDDLLEGYGKKLDKVIHFDLSEEAAIERMSLRRVCPVCQENWHLKYKKPQNPEKCDHDGAKLEVRHDDEPEQIKMRLSEYNRTISPILEQYRARGILLNIDAAPSIEDVHKSVYEKLSLS